MDIIFATALLVLAAMVLVLFAMFGELARAIGLHHEADVARPLVEARVGDLVGAGPGGIVFERIRWLLVLSTSCVTCRLLAGQANELADLLEREAAVIVVGPDTHSVRQFVSEYDLDSTGLDVLPDIAGSWTRTSCGVEASPALIELREGRIHSAATFAGITALASVVERSAA